MSTETTTFVSTLAAEARTFGGCLALPESFDPRVLEAARQLLALAAVRWVHLFGEPEAILAIAKQSGINLEPYRSALRWSLPSDQNLPQLCRAHFQALATARGKPFDRSELDKLGETPLEQSAYLLAKAEVDAVVAGCVTTTAEVIRAARRGVGLANGNQTISGSFAMVRERPQETPKHFMFADCAVVIDPSVPQLIDIAAATRATFQALFPNQEPVLAFLSFSTKGSAKHPYAEKMAEAAHGFQQRYPEACSDGELQFDAALLPEIALRKAPGSKAAGRANCFIFPDLNAGNIAYKITERLAGFNAYGPILQGLALPFSDLSRGASAEDIVVSSLMALLRAQSLQRLASASQGVPC